jgi:hypothetical protein
MKIIKDVDGNEYAEVDVKNTGETKGGAVWFDDGNRKFCVPKSCMEDWPDVGNEGTALIVIWFAEQEGLI